MDIDRSEAGATSTSLLAALDSYVAASACGDDAPLASMADVNATLENDSTRQQCLTRVLEQLRSGLRFEELVRNLGEYLTHQSAAIRQGGMQLLASVLESVPELPLPPPTLQHTVNFFCERLQDYPAVPACLRAMECITRFHSAALPQGLAATMAKAVFKELHVPSLTQPMRHSCFALFHNVLQGDRFLPELQEMGADFAFGVAQSMEAEKDPRCLLLCLDVVRTILARFDDRVEAAMEELFEVTACYYPITFTPPPNDPHGITKAQLVNALRAVFCARVTLARFVIPLLLEKLSSSLVDAKLDALATLRACFASYPVPCMTTWLREIADSMFAEATTAQDGGVASQALLTLNALARLLALHVRSSGDRGVWESSVEPLLQRCMREVHTAPDSMLARGAARCLCAVAASNDFGFEAVLRASTAPLCGLLHVVAAPEQRCAVLQMLVDITAVIDKEVCMYVCVCAHCWCRCCRRCLRCRHCRHCRRYRLSWVTHAVGVSRLPQCRCAKVVLVKPPMAAFAPNFVAAFVQQLAPPPDAEHLAPPAQRALAVQGLANLLTRPPAPLMPTAEVCTGTQLLHTPPSHISLLPQAQAAAACFADAIMRDADAGVRSAATEALVGVVTKAAGAPTSCPLGELAATLFSRVLPPLVDRIAAAAAGLPSPLPLRAALSAASQLCAVPKLCRIIAPRLLLAVCSSADSSESVGEAAASANRLACVAVPPDSRFAISSTPDAERTASVLGALADAVEAHKADSAIMTACAATASSDEGQPCGLAAALTQVLLATGSLASRPADFVHAPPAPLSSDPASVQATALFVAHGVVPPAVLLPCIRVVRCSLSHCGEAAYEAFMAQHVSRFTSLLARASLYRTDCFLRGRENPDQFAAITSIPYMQFVPFLAPLCWARPRLPASLWPRLVDTLLAIAWPFRAGTPGEGGPGVVGVCTEQWESALAPTRCVPAAHAPEPLQCRLAVANALWDAGAVAASQALAAVFIRTVDKAELDARAHQLTRKDASVSLLSAVCNHTWPVVVRQAALRPLLWCVTPPGFACPTRTRLVHLPHFCRCVGALAARGHDGASRILAVLEAILSQPVGAGEAAAGGPSEALVSQLQLDVANGLRLVLRANELLQEHVHGARVNVRDQRRCCALRPPLTPPPSACSSRSSLRRSLVGWRPACAAVHRPAEPRTCSRSAAPRPRCRPRLSPRQLTGYVSGHTIGCAPA